MEGDSAKWEVSCYPKNWKEESRDGKYEQDKSKQEPVTSGQTYWLQ